MQNGIPVICINHYLDGGMMNLCSVTQKDQFSTLSMASLLEMGALHKYSQNTLPTLLITWVASNVETQSTIIIFCHFVQMI